LIFLFLVSYLLITLIRNSGITKTYNSLSTEGQKVAHISLLVFSFSAIFIQSSTLKIQLEYSKLGDVYISYLYGALFASLCIYFVVSVVIAESAFKKIRVPLCALLCITISSNVISFGVLWKVNQVNVKILSSISEGSQREDLCRTEDAWWSTNHSEQYKLQVSKGFDARYMSKFGKEFCD
jgi:hypothetical protein